MKYLHADPASKSGDKFNCWFSYCQTMPVSQGWVKLPKYDTNKALFFSDWADIGSSLVKTMNIRSLLVSSALRSKRPYLRQHGAIKEHAWNASFGIYGRIFSLNNIAISGWTSLYPDAYSPQNTHCYFARCGNFKLPRIESIKASKIRYFLYFLQALSQIFYHQ